MRALCAALRAVNIFLWTWIVLKIIVVVCLLLSGCTGQLVDALEQRQISSCIWWHGPLQGHGVTATGNATLAQCLAVPCQGR